MASQDTVFTNDAGAAGGSSSYVQDVLPDVTFPANSNGTLTSNSNTNPMGLMFSNTDLPQLGAKVLQIKDLILIQDRSKWINNKTTYQVVFYESFPQINCYVFGNIQFNYQLGQPTIQFKTIGDGISVNGVVRRVAFVLQPNTSATATAQVVVDGVNGNTIDFSSFTAAAPSPETVNQFSPYVHKATNETYDLHDIRLTSLQANTLIVGGVIVYFQNTGSNVDQFPGTTYVNKTKSTTINGATMALPSFGSSLGGKATIYKTTFGGYTISALSATTIASLATGSSGTNLLTVTTGQGASFSAGYGVVVSQGSSAYIGSVISVSTDTLTMGNTLGFGTSTTAAIYTAWKSGSTLAVNASLMRLAYTVDFSKYGGLSQTIFEPSGNYAFWGNNIGISLIDGNLSAVFLGASGFMQLDGYFSAAEIETIGNGIFSATLAINGFPSWSQNAGQTGSVKKTVFTDAGPGWNNFNIGVGASMGALGINKINLYQRNRDIGVSYGLLAEFDTCQTYTDRGVINASFIALGGVRRIYADQLYLKGQWVRGQGATAAGGVIYSGCTTNAVLSMQYYGKNFGIVGTVNGGTLTLDGSGIGLTFGIMQTVSTEDWHTVNYTCGAGTTSIIHAMDVVRSTEKFKTDANVVTSVQPSSASEALTSEVIVDTGNGQGGTNTGVRRFSNIRKNIGTAITYVDSSANGGQFFINKQGTYSIHFEDNYSGGSVGIGIIVNGTALTSASNAPNLTYAQGKRAGASSGAANQSTCCFWSGTLYPGDIIYAGSVANATDQTCMFSIVKGG